MRLAPFLLPILFASLGLSASAEPKDTTRPVRTEKGEPRVRDASTARAASARVPAPATSRSRPYRAPRPGEGEPRS
ncbi:MAG: hypothetical protein HGA66_10770 [Holophaga sp.]|nr:hypothetical protein [Holophaga sp.]